MARLYANENFPQPVVQELRRLGHDVLTVVETGKAEQSWPDEAVLEFARSEGRAILTLNRKHFIKLHQQSPDHAGIVCCTFDPGFRISLHQKDLNLALASARELGVSLPNTATAQELFNACAAHGGKNWDHSAMVRALEKLSNFEIGQKAS